QNYIPQTIYIHTHTHIYIYTHTHTHIIILHDLEVGRRNKIKPTIWIEEECSLDFISGLGPPGEESLYSLVVESLHKGIIIGNSEAEMMSTGNIHESSNIRWR
ncbi:hypothetical protein OWV82_005967, partial [Melia azedarach]